MCFAPFFMSATSLSQPDQTSAGFVPPINTAGSLLEDDYQNFSLSPIRGSRVLTLCYPFAQTGWKNKLYFGDNLGILRRVGGMTELFNGAFAMTKAQQARGH
jgi:hypothetical protein